MRRNLCAYLQDILDAADDIEMASAGLSFDTFANVDTVYSTVLLKLLVIGEALRQMKSQNLDLLSSVSDLESIVGLRNRLIHGYFDIDAAIVWDAIKQDLPRLFEQVSELQQLHCPNARLRKPIS